MRLHNGFLLTLLSSLCHAASMQRTWIWSTDQNLDATLQLNHIEASQITIADYNFTPSPKNQTELAPGHKVVNLPYPGFWTCPMGTALPPNTEDCLEVINDTYERFGNATIDVPADRCIHVAYRSCLMYACSSPCGGFTWKVNEWYNLAVHLRNSCILQLGGGGYVQRQPGGRDEAFVYRAGLTHIDGIERLLTPPIVC